jgi:hydrogenase 3 maturation protease
MHPASRLRNLAIEGAAGETIVLLGIGNEMRGDDGVGHLVAQDLAALDLPFLHAFPVGISLENATHLVARHHADILILVDAVSDSGRPLGTWDFFEPERLDCFIHSTHSVPLSLFVAYWKREIPGLEVHFIGINIHGTDSFRTLSPEVETTRTELTRIFKALLHP